MLFLHSQVVIFLLQIRMCSTSCVEHTFRTIPSRLKVLLSELAAEGSPSFRHIRPAPQRERFDSHDLRRGFAELKTHSHGAAARVLRLARSPHRVRRAQDKFARRRSESASTRAISANGLASSRHVGTVPQDTLHGATARVRRTQDTFAWRFSQSASTRTISAEGCSELKIHLHDATVRALGSPSSKRHEKRTAVSQNAALAMEICVNTQIRRSARRHGESAVVKKGPFQAKLSHARQLFATTAMALELRLYKRRRLTRQEDITAWRPCRQERTLLPTEDIWHEAQKRLASRKNTEHVPSSKMRQMRTAPLTRAHVCVEDNFSRTGPAL